MLLFVPPYCRCHDNGRFRFTVIGYGLGLAVTSRFLWTAPYTNEILDVDTSKKTHCNCTECFVESGKSAVTKLRARKARNRGSIRGQEQANFHFSNASGLAMGSIQPPIKCIPRISDRKSPSGAKLKNWRRYTSTIHNFSWRTRTILLLPDIRWPETNKATRMSPL